MKVTINEREYELKELTKEQAKAYIGKEVYVWDCTEDAPVKRKLLEVFMPECTFSFCVLHLTGIDAFDYAHCAPVPEEWYVYEASDGHFFFHCDAYPDYKKVDHGSHDYCVTKARELNDKEMPYSECKHNDEPMVACSGCGDNKSKFERKEATEHPLTNYELTQLLKCFGVDYTHKCNYNSAFNGVHQTYTYPKEEDKENCRGDIVIRYKCGEWMPATRETVMKWWCRESSKSNMSEFVSFMGWDKE